MKRIFLCLIAIFCAAGAIVAGLYFFGNSRNGLSSWNASLIRRDLAECGSATREVKCVVEGKGGWLFLQESFLGVTVPWKGNEPSIIAFRDSLRARGIELIVVPVPDKFQIESRHYLYFTDKSLIPGVYADWLAKLRAAGVRVVDEVPHFAAAKDSVNLFDPYESHCSSAARELLAKSVADEIQKMNLNLPRSGYTLKDSLANGSGNLYYLKYQKYAHYKVHESSVLRADGTMYHGPRNAPILVIGDSNVGQGHVYSSDIASLITQATGYETYAISKVGAGNFGPRMFKGKAKFLENRKVLVWVFDGRELYGRVVMPEF